MKHCAVLVLFPVVVACGGAESVFEGDWKYAPAELETMAPPMRASLASAVLTIRDGRLSAPDGSNHGYKVVATHGNKFTLEATDGRDEGRRIVIELDGDTLKMTKRGITVAFVRAK